MSDDQGKVITARKGKRLKGLDEFEKPEFVGRMVRAERRKRIEWWAMVAAASPWAARLGGG